MGQKYVNIKELSIYLGVAVKTLYEWVNRRFIPHYKFGKSVRFDIDEVILWAKQCRKGSLNDEFRQ